MGNQSVTAAEDFPVAPSLREAVAHVLRDLIGLVEYGYAKEVLLQIKACESPQLVEGGHCPQ